MSAATDYPGRLIAFEGIDTVSNALQVNLLADWLQLEGYGVQVVTPGSSRLISPSLRTGTASRSLQSISYSLLQATDVREQTVHVVIPALRSGFMVLINPYLQTILAKNLARGHESGWAENLFAGIPPADMTFYFRTTPERAFEQLTTAGPLDYYENGLDLAPGKNARERFMQYQNRVVTNIEALHENHPFEIIDLAQSVGSQQEKLLAAAREVLP